MDRFRTFQIASGIFLAAYVLGHMNSVFVFARHYLGIDSDWAFATGARRTHVVRIFPNTESCLRLVRALAVETHVGSRNPPPKQPRPRV